MSDRINKILKSKSVNWKIKSKLREGKNCYACKYGTNDFESGYCTYNMEHSPSWETPCMYPHLLTCNNYER